MRRKQVGGKRAKKEANVKEKEKKKAISERKEGKDRVINGVKWTNNETDNETHEKEKRKK